MTRLRSMTSICWRERRGVRGDLVIVAVRDDRGGGEGGEGGGSGGLERHRCKSGVR